MESFMISTVKLFEAFLNSSENSKYLSPCCLKISNNNQKWGNFALSTEEELICLSGSLEHEKLTRFKKLSLFSNFFFSLRNLLVWILMLIVSEVIRVIRKWRSTKLIKKLDNSTYTQKTHKFCSFIPFLNFLFFSNLVQVFQCDLSTKIELKIPTQAEYIFTFKAKRKLKEK